LGKLNDLDLQAWLADVLAHTAGKATVSLLHWKWKKALIRGLTTEPRYPRCSPSG
jgi:hypothetical protein